MDEVEALLRECMCSGTGASIIREVHRTSPEDPFAVPKSNGDMEIIWDGEPLGISTKNMVSWSVALSKNRRAYRWIRTVSIIVRFT